MKAHNGKLTADPIEKANSLKFYYASLNICESNNPQIQSTESGKTFTINIKTRITRKRLSAMWEKIRRTR